MAGYMTFHSIFGVSVTVYINRKKRRDTPLQRMAGCFLSLERDDTNHEMEKQKKKKMKKKKKEKIFYLLSVISLIGFITMS